jgi:dihydrofolate synthase / folylpolyglutamate synthase
MDYQQAQDYIASLAQRGWRLGLDRMTEFAARADLVGSLGDGDSPKFIHVAGTNGKGSVTAMLQSCLVDQGHRTGAFFSPYVVDPRERIQFGREMISKEDLAAIATKLMPIGESLSETEFGGVTEFEFKTAMGFEYWKQKECDWVALEVGLGGRLDATNIITPASSAIVSISYDHVSILGETLAEIAREKAGVIKPGRPVVVGEMPDEAFEGKFSGNDPTKGFESRLHTRPSICDQIYLAKSNSITPRLPTLR